MTRRAYLRPVGRLTLCSDRATPLPGDAMRIAGRNDLVFTGLEITARQILVQGSGSPIDQSLLSLDAAREMARDATPEAHHIEALLDRLAAPRASIAGLALDRPRIMGIVNVTPDSFSDGNMFADAQAAIDHALKLERAGADILDIGGESTRPGAQPVPLDEELARVMPVVEGLAGRTQARISVDTRKAEVMRRAADAGAHMINDVSALSHDPQSLPIARATGLPIVLMHAQGDPRTMQHDPRYDDVLLDVYDWLEERVATCIAAGISRDRLLVDPGIGFGKTTAHNLTLITGASLFHGLGCGLLLGASRKSFIGKLSGAADPAARMPGSVAAALAGAMQGAQILRVHDVAETRQALSVWEAVTSGAAPTS